MAPVPSPAVGSNSREQNTGLRRLLGGMSLFTLGMTVPQVYTVWVAHEASGVSILSWGAYLLPAILWFWFGLHQRDKNIYLPCVGWIVLDGAEVAGILVYG
jgi:hypothetical protein